MNFTDIFENAVDEGYGPNVDLTPGRYEGAFTFANTGETKAGDPKLGFLFVADEGSKSDTGEDMTGGSIWLNLYFSEKAINFAVKDAKALGLTPAMLDTDAGAAVNTVVGKRFSVTVKLSKNGDFTNLYLGKALGGAAAAPAVPVPAAPAADDGDVWNI